MNNLTLTPYPSMASCMQLNNTYRVLIPAVRTAQDNLKINCYLYETPETSTVLQMPIVLVPMTTYDKPVVKLAKICMLNLTKQQIVSITKAVRLDNLRILEGIFFVETKLDFNGDSKYEASRDNNLKYVKHDDSIFSDIKDGQEISIVSEQLKELNNIMPEISREQLLSCNDNLEGKILLIQELNDKINYYVNWPLHVKRKWEDFLGIVLSDEQKYYLHKGWFAIEESLYNNSLEQTEKLYGLYKETIISGLPGEQ